MSTLLAQVPDIFATKGTEYLISILFMLLLVPFWIGLYKPAKSLASAKEMIPHWLRLPDGFSLHPGHVWARALGGGRRVRLGWDAFAAHLVGEPEAVLLPAPGERLEQGKPIWRVQADGAEVPMLSPVDGTVTALNPEVVVRPELAARDAYGDGWLVEVEVPRRRRSLGKLLRADAARRWLDETAARFAERLSPQLGTVMADGGEPVMGFARELDPEGWVDVAAEAFGTSAVPAAAADE